MWNFDKCIELSRGTQKCLVFIKIPFKVSVEESIVNAPLVSLSSTCRLKTQTTQKVRLDLQLLTIDSPTPTLTGNFN
jgi:hypothetical protein